MEMDISTSSTPNPVPTTIRTAAPSYIKSITGSDEGVKLIYGKKVCEKNPEVSPLTIEDTNATLDLTGNPLEVDLNSGDCTLNVSVAFVVNLWSDDENERGSLDLKAVRKAINSELAKCHLADNVYIYGLCNGKDKNKTVMLGARQTDKTLSRTQAFVDNLFTLDDEIGQKLENMKKEHCKNAQSSISSEAKISHTIRGTYVLYGYKVSPGPALLNSKFSGLISCDITWSTFRYSVPQYVDSIEMTLQVIIGHRASQLHSRWNHLVLLKKYIDILSTPHCDLGAVVLNEHSIDCMDIIASYDTFFDNTPTIPPPPPNKEDLGLNLDNLRWEIFTDKLWELLISCGTVNDLRFCLHNLFEQLVVSKLCLNVKDFPAHDTSFISKVLIETSNGRIAVPTLSPVQALTSLIELGTEKLKRDYFYIFDYCNCLSQEQAIKHWESIDQQEKPPATAIASKSASRMTAARARFTVCPTTTILSSQHILFRYHCLLSMHVACDVLVFALKVACLHQNLVDKVKTCLLSKEINIKVPSNPLFEVKVKLDNDKLKSMTLLNPVALNIRFCSANKKDTVETIFHHTTKKLFPPAVYDDYVVLSDANGNNSSYYYVTKLVRYTKNLP